MLCAPASPTFFSAPDQPSIARLRRTAVCTAATATLNAISEQFGIPQHSYEQLSSLCMEMSPSSQHHRFDLSIALLISNVNSTIQRYNHASKFLDQIGLSQHNHRIYPQLPSAPFPLHSGNPDNPWFFPGCIHPPIAAHAFGERGVHSAVKRFASVAVRRCAGMTSMSSSLEMQIFTCCGAGCSMGGPDRLLRAADTRKSPGLKPNTR